MRWTRTNFKLANIWSVTTSDVMIKSLSSQIMYLLWRTTLSNLTSMSILLTSIWLEVRPDIPKSVLILLMEKSLDRICLYWTKWNSEKIKNEKKRCFFNFICSTFTVYKLNISFNKFQNYSPYVKKWYFF